MEGDCSGQGGQLLFLVSTNTNTLMYMYLYLYLNLWNPQCEFLSTDGFFCCVMFLEESSKMNKI